MMARHGGFQEALPAVALYAFAGYRLMPAVQKIYEEVTLLPGQQLDVGEVRLMATSDGSWAVPLLLVLLSAGAAATVLALWWRSRR